MSYSIFLSQNEICDLAWAVDRGYFPTLTYDKMRMADNVNEQDYEDGKEVEWIIPEYAAWEILHQREDDPHSLYTCLGGELLEKLQKLENSII